MKTLKTLFCLLIGISFVIATGFYCKDVQAENTRLIKVTAYCSCEKCCGKYADGITASGHKIQKGDKFCAAPKNIPFGTMLTIPGYGRVPARDRGGAIVDGCLDVFFDDHETALQWGVQWLEVKQ